jgi:hypothetical protein
MAAASPPSKPVAARRGKAATPATDHAMPYGGLTPWIPEPTLIGPTLAWLDKQEKPVLLREIAEGLGVPNTSLSAVLERLSGKRLVRRWKVPIVMPHNRYAGRTMTRKMWLYQVIKEKGRPAKGGPVAAA